MGFITGTVADPTGDAIEDATVTVTDADTGDTVATTTTNSSGDYTVSVSEGTYDVAADKVGFEPRSVTGVSVGSSETVTVDFTTTRRAYKIRGELTDDYGIGVLGRNPVDSGTPIGVRGRVPNATGYGLETPDDARIVGDIDTASGHTLSVDGTPALRLGPEGSDSTFSDTASGNVVGGARVNAVSGAVGAVIGGGGSAGDGNEVTDDYGAVLGGRSNTVSDLQGAVGGGTGNVASGRAATVAGGLSNVADGEQAVVAGGRGNEAFETYSAVGGGNANRTGTSGSSGFLYATVPGGFSNVATGQFSFAAGREATAAADGTLAWGDGSSTGVTATTGNAVEIQAGGGATVYSSSDLSTGVRLPQGGGSWGSVSTRAAKTDFQPVDTDDVLDRVIDLEIATWEYDSEEPARHMGPTAEGFHDAFELGVDDSHIPTVDADGVALAAIKGLAGRLEHRDEQIDTHERRIRDQAEQIDDLERENERLRERLATLEAAVDTGDDDTVSEAAVTDDATADDD